ncbi:MAG: hypothetical protein AAFZ87_06335, partial [Planctomycetota bacterium]
MDAAEPGVVAGHAAEAFDAAGVRYLVGGSVASTLHGEPRGTLDVDFAVHLGEEQVDPLAAALEEHFIVDVASIAEAAAALPLVLTSEGRRYEAHEVLGLVERPNGGQARAEFFEALYGQLL